MEQFLLFRPMKCATASQIHELDRLAINKYGIPSLSLMENAGKAVADKTAQMLRKKNPCVSIFCGLGNNAGDGFVAARHLMNKDINVRLFVAGKASNLKQDAYVNYLILKKMKYPIITFKEITQPIIGFIRKSDIVVDALFGVGLNRDIEGALKSTVEALNCCAKRIISVDIPSGLDATTGKIHGVCIKADTTVTFTLPKSGFYKNQGPQYAGKIVVADIGIPKKFVERFRN